MTKVCGLQTVTLRVVGLYDGFQMPENIFPNFSLKEKLMWNLTQVVSYFSKHL